MKPGDTVYVRVWTNSPNKWAKARLLKWQPELGVSGVWTVWLEGIYVHRAPCEIITDEEFAAKLLAS